MSLEDQKIQNIKEIQEYISKNAEKEIHLGIQQDISSCGSDEFCAATKNISVTPNSEGKIGVYIGKNVALNEDFEYKYSF